MSRGFSNAILPDCPPGESVGLAADPFVNCSEGSSMFPTCKTCGNPVKKQENKYCSRGCFHASRRMRTDTRVDRECVVCGEAFQSWSKTVARGHGKYCSRGCYSTVSGGENHGNWKGGITPESKRIRGCAEYKTWRRAVFARDKYTCQECGDSKGGNLNAHHIFKFAEYEDRRFDVANGVTLCRGCHEFIHGNAKVA